MHYIDITMIGRRKNKKKERKGHSIKDVHTDRFRRLWAAGQSVPLEKNPDRGLLWARSRWF